MYVQRIIINIILKSKYTKNKMQYPKYKLQSIGNMVHSVASFRLCSAIERTYFLNINRDILKSNK